MVSLIWRGVTGSLGVNPIETLTHTTGLTALVLLLVALSVTPVRKLTGWNWIGGLRRLLGLWAFTYSLMHFLVWFVFDHQLSPAGLVEDVAERPFITAGFTAFLILSLLAATSPKAVVRRLGGRRWRAIHRLVYLAAGLVVVHFIWLVKKDLTEPLLFGGVLALLLSLRIGKPLWNSARRSLEPSVDV